jgi:hypothetical protein
MTQTPTPSDELLRAHNALVPSDNAVQRQLRLRQALWRERSALPIGAHRGRPLGSRLPMPFAQDTLANYLTETVRDVVRAEVLDPHKSAGKLYTQPRIFEDLLSSQPLCFNLFAELQRDLALASRAFAVLLGQPDVRVMGIEFEHSPGRGSERFTGDASAFDVFVRYEFGESARGFVGLEVKYAETMQQPPARHRARYEAVADAMGVFVPEARPRLREAPLEQLWRDHLLAGSLLLDEASGFARGAFAVVYPSENVSVADAAQAYRGCLRDDAGFRAWTLEELLDVFARCGDGPWVGEVRGRYLGPA